MDYKCSLMWFYNIIMAQENKTCDNVVKYGATILTLC